MEGVHELFPVSELLVGGICSVGALISRSQNWIPLTGSSKGGSYKACLHPDPDWVGKLL